MTDQEAGYIRRVLVVRACLSGRWGNEQQYGKIEAHAAVLKAPAEPLAYESYSFYGLGDDEAGKVRLEGFRAEAQTDGSRDEAYGFTWGYAPAFQGMVTGGDIRRIAPHIGKIQTRLERLRAKEGNAVGLGMEVMRLARALDASRVVTLAFEPTRSSFAGAAVEDAAPATDAPAVVSMVWRLEHKLQRACAAREGRKAA